MLDPDIKGSLGVPAQEDVFMHLAKMESEIQTLRSEVASCLFILVFLEYTYTKFLGHASQLQT